MESRVEDPEKMLTTRLYDLIPAIIANYLDVLLEGNMWPIDLNKEHFGRGSVGENLSRPADRTEATDPGSNTDVDVNRRRI